MSRRVPTPTLVGATRAAKVEGLVNPPYVCRWLPTLRPLFEHPRLAGRPVVIVRPGQPANLGVDLPRRDEVLGQIAGDPMLVDQSRQRAGPLGPVEALGINSTCHDREGSSEP